MKKKKLIAIIMVLCIIFTNINVFAKNSDYGTTTENGEFKTKD